MEGEFNGKGKSHRVSSLRFVMMMMMSRRRKRRVNFVTSVKSHKNGGKGTELFSKLYPHPSNY
jgi:hypothetical protein